MPNVIRCQGRDVGDSDLAWMRALIASNPQWSLHRLTKEIASAWNWRTHTGTLKTFAARSFLLKLQERGLLSLPALRLNMRRPKKPFPSVDSLGLEEPAPLTCRLGDIQPLQFSLVRPGSDQDAYFLAHLVSYHYLGLRSIVGENLRYLVSERSGTPVACLLFASSAWKSNPRDHFIGWSARQREDSLYLTTNNCRFLIFPWVKVAHLASHILARLTRRLSSDWRHRYGHPIHLVETFVERGRFAGTCYRAANWIDVGPTQGRGRQDRYHRLPTTVKDVYLYPLSADWRGQLHPSS